MPRKAVAAATMAVGKKGGGKHWTDAEVEKRKRAAESLTRATVTITCPTWLPKDARAVWDKSIADAAELELLDNLDSNQLAAYCITVAEYQYYAQKSGKDIDESRFMLALSKELLAYADKLGFTPQARARLAQKRAAKALAEDNFGKAFDEK